MNWHPLAEVFPMLQGAELDRFVAGIKKTGGCKENKVKYRMVDGAMQGLDGRERYAACKKLGIKCDMQKVTVPDEQVVEFILRHNINRKHITPEAREALVVELRKQGESLRTIGEQLNTSPRTVARTLEAAGVADATPDGEKVTGKDGKQYSATKTVLCKRCARIGSEARGGCPKCEAERQKAQRKKAERSTSKRKQGAVLFDAKTFNDAFGYWLRQIDKIGRPFNAHNSKEAEAFRDEIEGLKKRVLEWQRKLANAK